MELYRVLLVDDEEDIRVGISRKMDWASLGFALVGEAENGRDVAFFGVGSGENVKIQKICLDRRRAICFY